MPLDRTHGEVIDGLPASMHVVVAVRRIAEMTNLLVPYLKKKKFGYEEKVRPLFADAVTHAIEAFAAAGALRPIRFDEDDVLVQVYPKDRKVAVLFQRRVAGVEQYVSRIYDLPQEVVESLLVGSGAAVREH